MNTTIEKRNTNHDEATNNDDLLSVLATTPVVDADKVRAIAESLQSIRGKDSFVVIRGGELVATDRVITGDIVLFTCRTEFTVKDRLQFKALTATRQSNTVVDLLEFDAIFTSEAAYEKFARPYYASLLGEAELHELEVQFNQANVYALVHLPKSEPSTVKDALRLVTETALVPI